MVVPTGFAVPSAPYAIGLLVGTGIVAAVLWQRRVRFTEKVVVAFVPWIAFGAGLHVIHQLDAAPELIRPLLGTPAAYFTTFVIAGSVWALTHSRTTQDQGLNEFAIAGIVCFGATLVVILSGRDSIHYGWPVIGGIFAVGLTAVSWASLAYFFPDTTDTTGGAGLLVVFGQSVDGVSTAIGVDFLGLGERTPAARVILEFAELLPLSEVLGVGWLFVLVKLVLALGIVRFLTGLVRSEPAKGYLFLGIIMAVGLGPGVHNLLLYLVV